MTELRSTPEFPTLAEAFVGRALEKERRAGVDHYVEGQHHAELQRAPEEGMAVAQLQWVNALGLAVTVVVKMLPDGEWETAVPSARMLGLSFDYGMQALPADFKLNDGMKAALAKVDQEIAKGDT